LTNKKTPQSPRPKNDDATNDCSEVLSKKSKIISEETTETSAKKSKISTEETTENSLLVPEQQILFSKSINDLPEEILIFIFSHLNPRSLVACGAANRRWRNLAFSSVFWKALYPTQWARGQWSFDYHAPDLKVEDDIMASFTNLSSASSSLSSSLSSLDDDVGSSPKCEESADVNPLAPLAPNSSSSKKYMLSCDEKIFEGIAVYLLPKIGSSVVTLILSASIILNDKHTNALLAQVPNVRTVNLSFTHITSEAFGGLYKNNALRKLEDLNLTGCIRITDNLLAHLSRCFSSQNKRPSSRSKLRKLSLSGCRSITSMALQYLIVHAVALQELDLSGCYKIDGETLTSFVQKCPRLKPERLAYCNDIEDGPYQDEANGCLNLECEIRFCCQQMRN